MADDLDKKQSGLDGRVTVTFHDNVAVITMDCGQNRCNKLMTARMNKALDDVLANERAEVLITTGTGKYYSNGLDLDWLSAMGGAGRTDELMKSVTDSSALAARILTFPLPTIAALNGHCYAMGAVNSLCHDYRIMRTGRGWWSLNEVHLGLNFSEGIRRVVNSKLPVRTSHESAVLGKVYTAEEGINAGVVDRTSPQENFLQNAIQMATDILPKGGYKRENMGMMKESVYEEAKELLERPRESGSSFGRFASRL